MNQTVNVFDCLNDLTVNPSNKDHVYCSVLDFHEQYPNSEIYKVHLNYTGSKLKLFAFKHQLSIKFHDKFYPITVIVYLPFDYPNAPPDIYLDKSLNNIGINPKFLDNKEIDIYTFRLNLPALRNWNRSTGTIKGILIEIENAFNTTFPVYKNKDPIVDLNSNSPANFNNIEKYKVDFGMSKENVMVSSQQQKNGDLVKKNYTDKEIKDLYLKELFNHLMPIAIEKYDRLKSDEDNIQSFQGGLQSNFENVTRVLSNKEGYIRQIESTILEINREIEVLNQYIINNSNSQLNLENIGEVIDMSNEKLIRAVSVEANIEELLLIVKKAFDKQITSLEETVKFIRNLSRELFKVKYYREKIQNNFY